MLPEAAARFEGTSGAMAIHSPAPGVVVLEIEGHDVGEFGSGPIRRVEGYLSNRRPIHLYIDARRTKGVSIGVSSEWALWLLKNRTKFGHIRMLPGSRFIEVTADFVRRFAGLESLMRIYSDEADFDEALASAIDRATTG